MKDVLKNFDVKIYKMFSFFYATFYFIKNCATNHI